MHHHVYGLVTESSGKKQVVIVGVGNAESQKLVGRLLRFGAYEKGLSKYRVGSWVDAFLYETAKGVLKSHFDTIFTYHSRKDFEVKGSFFVTLLGVNSQVPTDSRLLSEALSVPLSVVKTGWFMVSSTGNQFTFEVPMSIDDGKAAVGLIHNLHCLAALVDVDGNVVYMPESEVVSNSNPATVPAKKTKDVHPKKELPSDYFYVEDDANLVFSTVANQYMGGFTGSANILVTGESGTGKTTIAKRFADKMGWGCHRLNCALITEASDIAGQRGIKNGETVWEWSAVGKAIAGGNCVVILDELNRAYPNALNALFGLLDDSRRTWFNDIELVVGQNVVFIATINEGSQYTGTFQADAALLNRFQFVLRMGNVPKKEMAKILISNFPSLKEEDVAKILKIREQIVLKIDGLNCPIRTIKSVSSAICGGMSHREAWEFVLVNTLSDSYKREIIDLLNSNLGVYSPEKTTVNLIF